MVQIVKADTYAVEDVGGGVEVRRKVFAGGRVPDHWNVDGKTETPDEADRITGYSPDLIEQRVQATEGEGVETNVPEPHAKRSTRRGKEDDS